MRNVKINRGINSDTPANEVPQEHWEEFIGWRRATATMQIPIDCRALIYFVEDGATTKDWVGYGTRDAYLREGLGIDPLTVDWAIEGLKIYDGKDSTITFHEAAELGKPSNILARAPTLARPGGDRYKNQDCDASLVSKTKYGTTGYFAARIKRDRPDIAARIDEFPSVRAAARVCGFVKDKPKQEVLRNSLAKATPEELEACFDEFVKFFSELTIVRKILAKASNEDKEAFLKEIDNKV